MINPIIKKYYTYQELLDLVNIEGIQMPRFPHDMEMSSNWFTALIEAGGLEVAIYTLGELFTDDLLNQIINALMGIVYNRHSKDFISWIEPTGDDGEDMNLAMYEALEKLINVIDLTIPRYAVLLKQNEIYSFDPVAPIGSVSTGRTRFNDTPQDEGEYNDEEHASNVSKSISETQVDSGSIMSRLEELFKNFKPIILDWSNEFNSLFLKEEQL